jgi:RNA recognition motif-containing protein
MAKKLYVGNLERTVTEEELEALCEEYGEIVSVVIIKDRDSGVSRGFGFVEFSSQQDAEDAKNALNGLELKGRSLKVDDAREQRERRSSRDSRGGGGGYRRRSRY